MSAKAYCVPTPAEEIWIAVQEYSKFHKIPILVADAKACLDAIKEEKKPKAPEVYVTPKAYYGSPEFWKAHWEKKKANGWVPKAN